MWKTIVVMANLTWLIAAQSAKYLKYDNYSAVDFDSVTGKFIPTETDCVAQSNASPMTNGVVYNDALKICKVLTTYNNEILVNLHVNPGWTAYVKDISDRKVMVFKAQAGQTATAPSFSQFNVFVGTHGTYTSSYNAAVASLNTSNSCNCTYRSPFIDNWNVVEVYEQVFSNGLPLASLAFSATGTSYNSWHTKGNLISAAPYIYSNMRRTTFAVFVNEINCYRTFVLMESTTSNCNDNYYTVLTSEQCCAYGPSPYPNILVSLTKTGTAGNGNGILHADFFIISVKVKSRVRIVP